MVLRALRIVPGDALMIETGCPISHGRAPALGTVHTAKDADIIRADRTNPEAISITDDPIHVGETGVIATPAGNIRFPMTTVTCPIGTWGTAIAAIDKVAATLGGKAYDADPDAPVQLEYVRPDKAVDRKRAG